MSYRIYKNKKKGVPTVHDHKHSPLYYIKQYLDKYISITTINQGNNQKQDNDDNLYPMYYFRIPKAFY